MSRLRLVLLSVLAACAVSAVGASSASALEFYNASTGLLIQGLLNVVSLGGKFELRMEFGGGTLFHISCEHLDNRGWIHNGLDGSRLLGLGLWLILFLECKILKPVNSGCRVKGGNIHTLVKLLDLTIGSLAYVDLTPDEGTHFTVLEIEGCTNTGFDGNYPFNGTIVGLVNNTTSEIEFLPGAPNNKLTFGGNPAELEGKEKVEMEGGGSIEVR